MKQIILTDEAKFDIIEIENFLLYKWGLNVLLDFNEKFDKALEILSAGNALFERYEDTIYRKFLLTKHNYIIYKITEDSIYIIKVLQNFQDPEENYKNLTD